MSKQVVVSFADKAGSYQRAMKRLEDSLQQTGFDGQFLGYTDYAEIGSPTHKGDANSVPYAFKAFSIKKAMESGADLLLWCDSPVYATKSIQPIFDHINEHGYLFFNNIGYSIGDYTSDACLAKWGMSRDEAFTKKMLMACLLGFKLSHPQTQEFLKKYIDAASDGVSYMGDWTNDKRQTSLDFRVKGTRHDQSCASLIVAQMGLEITNAQQTFFAYTSHKGCLPISDSVCMWSEGMQ